MSSSYQDPTRDSDESTTIQGSQEQLSSTPTLTLTTGAHTDSVPSTPSGHDAAESTSATRHDRHASTASSMWTAATPSTSSALLSPDRLSTTFDTTSRPGSRTTSTAHGATYRGSGFEGDSSGLDTDTTQEQAGGHHLNSATSTTKGKRPLQQQYGFDRRSSSTGLSRSGTTSYAAAVTGQQSNRASTVMSRGPSTSNTTLQQQQRPGLKSRSVSRVRKMNSDEEDETFSDGDKKRFLDKNLSPAGFGNGFDQDDEVERRDRGEELVRKRMKDRAKAKKEQERLRKQREAASAASTSRRTSYHPSPSTAVEPYDLSTSGLRPALRRGESSSKAVSTVTSPTKGGKPRNTSIASTTRERGPSMSSTIDKGSSSVYDSEGEGGGTPTPGSPQHPRATSLRRMTSSISGKSEADGQVGEQEMDGDMFLERGARTSSRMSKRDGSKGRAPEQRVEEEENEAGQDATGQDEYGEDSDSNFDEELRRGGMESSDASDDDSIEDDGDVEYTLKDRQDAINVEHPFGLPIWKPALYKKNRSITRNAETALHATPSTTALRHLAPGNVLWTVVFGVWLAMICILISVVLFFVPWGGRKYGRVIFELAFYLFWPFGKYVEGAFEEVDEDEDHDGKQFDRDEIFGQNERGREDVASAGRSSVSSGERTQLISGGQQRDYGSNGDSGDTSGSERTMAPSDRQRRSSSPRKNLHLMQTSSHSIFRIRALGRVMYWISFYLIVAPLMLFVCVLCWAMVFTIPMAKLLWVLLSYLNDEPLSLHFRSPPDYSVPNSPVQKVRNGQSDIEQDEDAQHDEDRDGNGESGENSQEQTTEASNYGAIQYPLRAGQRAPRHTRQDVASAKRYGRLIGPNSKILLCTYRAAGFQYYKYTIDGVNIMFINLLSMVLFVVFDFLVLAPYAERHDIGGLIGFLASEWFQFLASLLSIIPLSYFIGMAVASISAQSSIGMGAVINASFGSIIEVLLYCIMLTQGKGNLVEGSIVGSILAGVLLMPGTSMIAGAARRKEQKFNARSAGVTSTLLIMSVIGVLAPTFFYEIYGSFELACTGCDPIGGEDMAQKCSKCYYQHVDPADDPFYQGTVKHLATWSAVLLVFSYLIGLWFSLRTHASQIWQNAGHRLEEGHHHPHEDSTGSKKETEGSGGDHDTSGGHDAPNWSRIKSASVLLVCTGLYAVVAEVLVDAVDVVLQGAAIPEKLLGVTLFALAPACTEFLNAISFAIHGNIALSMEIGSAYVLQACLIQVPAALAFSAIYGIGKSSHMSHYFTLVFPRWDSLSIVFSVFLLTYVYIEARSNYHRGSVLVVAYLVLLGGFIWAPSGRDTSDDPGFQLLSSKVDNVMTNVEWSQLDLWQKVQTALNSMRLV
ncbi:hypothetical protein OIO90_006527 [Microbotryomycetes sp. JL221]|nr:hypothetical protein OIO90_006527 [Microbotryomycetes sp. JL221]